MSVISTQMRFTTEVRTVALWYHSCGETYLKSVQQSDLATRSQTQNILIGRFVLFILSKNQYFSRYNYQVTGQMTVESGFDFRQKQNIFFFSTTFRLALRPTQPSIQWLHGAKRSVHEADHSSNASLRTVELYVYPCVFTAWYLTN